MADSPRITPARYWRLIRSNTNFRRMWIGQMISETGDWMYVVAIYDQLLKLTGGAATSIGFAFVMQVLPQMLISPMAGVLNDRLSRRNLMITADLSRAVIVALMLLAAHMRWIWLIYVLLFMETVFWGLFEPGRNAIIPNITKEGEETLTANSLSSITWSFNFAAGFSIGGFIAAFAGAQAVYILNSLSFLLSAFFLSRMKFNEPHTEHHPPLRFTDLFDFSPVVAGIRYVSNDARLFATMLCKFGLGFMAANWVLVTILGERKFPVTISGALPSTESVLGMSLLMAFRGLGALIGPLVGTYLAGHNEKKMRLGILMGFGMSATGYILLGQAQWLPLACLCLLWAHAGGSLIWVFSATLLQINTEDKFRGRVFSSEFAFMTLSMSISSFLAGHYIDKGYDVGAVATTAGCIMALPGLAWLLAQRLWRPQNLPAA